MYSKTHEFRARLEKLANSSCLPTHRFQNAVIHGDANHEFYEPTEWNNRQKIRDLLREVTLERKATTNYERTTELYNLEREIERQLKAGRLMRPQATKNFSRCFIDAAETVLNHDVFKRIKAMALEKCSIVDDDPINSTEQNGDVTLVLTRRDGKWIDNQGNEYTVAEYVMVPNGAGPKA